MSDEECAGGHAGRVTLPERKRLDHRGPLSVDVKSAWYFITICASGHRPWVGSRVPRDRDATRPDATATVPMDFDAIADAILSAARWYHEHGKWRLATFLVMPDHLHFIAHFPEMGDSGHAGRVTLPSGRGGHAGRVTLPSGRDGHAGRVTLPMTAVVQHFKSYLARTYGIDSQRGFFETRIRDDVHMSEKARYICGNPVRKGLCATADDWPYSFSFEADGQERSRGSGLLRAASPLLRNLPSESCAFCGAFRDPTDVGIPRDVTARSRETRDPTARNPL